MTASGIVQNPAAESAAETDHAPLLERIFELEVAEESYALGAVEGEIPEYVRGTYYVNGPARFRRGDLAYRHWLDGDGMVVALRFDGGGVTFTNRFVRTRKLQEEEAAGRALYRAFGTAFEGDRLARGIGLESPVNVSVHPFAGTLLAFGEQGLPWELDPETLETRGLHTFGRRLNPVSPFSAHPCFDPRSGEMVNFGVSFDPRRPNILLYSIAADGEVQGRRRIPIDRPVSMHDFGLSEHYAIFHLSPYLLDVRAVIEDGASVMDALDWRSELGTRLLVVRRDDGEVMADLPIGDRYCLHLVNCYEDCDQLVVDVVEFDEPVYGEYRTLPNLFRSVTPGRPVRFVIDTESWQLFARRQLPYDRSPDFPAIDPRLAGSPYRHFWMLGISKSGRPGRKFFDQLAHLDWRQTEPPEDVYQAPEGCYLGCEPVFIGHPDDPPDGPRRGVVLVKQFDARQQTDTYLLFDAYDVARGPIARLPLKRPVPPGFHAVFAPG